MCADLSIGGSDASRKANLGAPCGSDAGRGAVYGADTGPHSGVLGCEALRQITGYQRPADIARCLREQGVRVFHGRRGPWTTLDLINQAGGLGDPAANDTLDPRQVL
ncbi:DUF4224 domain-containing protein [Salinicola endophyticus]|uniref:DUF4224 domain-containing protein n=1 Tax=Salinicola endophyticus TaxID=1949083 RepID=UPI00249C6C38|nr:DUF4224 domain-containing protein [Salinicola endophyticus]